MTTFVDFAVGQGSTRITNVRKAIKRDGEQYDPRTDYWRQLREAIQDEFKHGWRGDQSLSAISRVSPNPKKVENYALCVDGLRRWTKGQTFGNARRESGRWDAYGLTVRVNPELLLTVGDSLHSVKLYFGADKLSKASTRTMLHLLATANGAASPAILDLRRGNLVTRGAAIPDLDVLLRAEAAQFMAMWNELGGS